MPHPPTPYAVLRPGPHELRFFHGDAVEHLRQAPAGSVDAIVTSPPYNLGIRYRTYDDGRPREEYLDWTGDWVAAAARALTPEGSLFLNVGAKPKDPWTALDVAQAARPHLELQNIIHWVKSIAIEKALAGTAGRARRRPRGRALQADQQQAVPQRLPRVRLSLQPDGATPLDRRAVGVKYQDKSNVTRWQQARVGSALPRQHLVPALRHHPEPRQGAAAPGHVPVAAARVLPAGCTALPRDLGLAVDPFLGLGSSAVACATLGVQLRRHRARRALPEGGDRPRPCRCA